LFSKFDWAEGAKGLCAAGSTTGVPQNRGLQLGEENAPLLGLPGSWQSKRRIHRIHDVTKQQAEGFPNSGWPFCS